MYLTLCLRYALLLEGMWYKHSSLLLPCLSYGLLFQQSPSSGIYIAQNWVLTSLASLYLGPFYDYLCSCIFRHLHQTLPL